MFIKNAALALTIAFTLSACSTIDHAFAPNMQKTSLNNPAPYSAPAITGKRKVGKPYEILGQMYYPIESSDGYRRKGIASWYGKDFHAKKTANGETYNMYDMTAAHPTLPIPTYVRVTNLDNGLSAVVRVNDRGPFLRGRAIDLSYKAAITLDMAEKGTAPVLIEALPTDGSVLNTRENLRITAPTAIAQNNASPTRKRKRLGFTNRVSNKNFVAKPIMEEEDLSPSTVVAIGSSHVYVQTGAFSNKDNAIREQASVSNVYANTKLMSFNRGNQQFHRVRIGPLNSVNDADHILAEIIAKGWNNARIVVD
tara:strand:+ start:95406 stop:96335 length:930 start_codon:yes stop_codon:yes gene_type:complete